MPNLNHSLAYRPLLAGVAVYNPHLNEVGTLGLIATSDGIDRWIVSCYHVLARDPSVVAAVPFVSGEVIFQGSAHDGVVARTDVGRADPALDCAAAIIEPGLRTLQGIVDLGAQSTHIAAPVVGMRVVKAGAETGVTEGIITRVEVDRVLIGPTPGFPVGYTMAAKGDSGSLWILADTRQPVAMHIGVRSTDGIAVGTSITATLAMLRLKLA